MMTPSKKASFCFGKKQFIDTKAMKTILNFEDKEISSQTAGGKTSHLAQLYQAGFTIPEAFILTTQIYDDLLKKLKVYPLINEAVLIDLATLGKNAYLVKESLKKIQEKILKAKLDLKLEKNIFNHFKKLDTKKVAVRSSATCEDQALSSFAGQFESYLSVTKSQLIKAIKKCWASTFNERVLAYCTYSKTPFASIKMAVIVQKMVFAEKGGVIFTKDVFRDNKDNLIIEAAKGLGEKVVSGLVNPERLFVDKKSGRIIEKESPEGDVLTPKEIQKLAKAGIEIEKIYHSPQDIEWAIEKGKIYILQTRPITG